MINFKEIAEGVLSGELKGTFVLRNGCTRNSSELSRNNNGLTETFPYYLVDNGTLTENGTAYEKVECEYDVVDFIIEDVHTMTEEQIKQNAEYFATHLNGEITPFSSREHEAYLAGAHSRDEEIKDLKGQVASLEHLREALVNQQAGLKTKLKIQQGLLDNAVSMLKDIYEDDDYFCDRLLDIPEEEKICEIYCDKEGVQCDCILRYLKHYKKEE